LDAVDFLQIAPIGPAELKVGEELGGLVITDLVAMQASLVTQGTSEEAFSLM